MESLVAKAEAGINELIEYLEKMAGESHSWSTTSYRQELEKELGKSERTIQHYLKVILSLKIIEIQEVAIRSSYNGKTFVITILKPGATVEKGPNFYQIKTP